MNKPLSLAAVAALSMACASDYDLKGKEVNVDPGQVTDCPFTPVSGTKISIYDCNPVLKMTMKNSVVTLALLVFMPLKSWGTHFIKCGTPPMGVAMVILE